MGKKVLVVLTSVDKIPGTDKETGWYLVSLFLPSRSAGYSPCTPDPPRMTPPPLFCAPPSRHSPDIRAQADPSPKPELAHPYDVLTAAGVELTIASPKGGNAPLDQNSVEMFKT